MGYEYSDPKRTDEAHSLPNVEVFHVGFAKDWRGPLTCHICQNWSDTEPETPHSEHVGWYFAFGFPGCLRDSEPVGPFDTYQEALDAARDGLED